MPVNTDTNTNLEKRAAPGAQGAFRTITRMVLLIGAVSMEIGFNSLIVSFGKVEPVDVLCCGVAMRRLLPCTASH